MYERENSLLLSASASALCNNLAVINRKAGKSGGNATNIAVVHQNNINIIPVTESEKNKPVFLTVHSNGSVLCEVTQVLWCDLGFEVVLVVGSTLGLHIYDRDGVELLFSHPCIDGPEEEYNFVKGIATLNNEVLCVGNSSGVLRVFGVLDEETCLSFMDRKEGHMDAITDIASIDYRLASADDSGVICLWYFNGTELLQIATVDTFGSAVTSLFLWKDWLAAAYGSGHIRIFDSSKINYTYDGSRPVTAVRLLTETAAHARYITAMDVALGVDYLLTASEDSYVKIWRVCKNNNVTEINLLCSSQISDQMLVGGRFLNKNGTGFCVSAYDTNLVHCFKT
uniref:WD repeat-containing protein 54 n=2 Tax=Cacopsylla melanoneura TaxID=428564 RepID=A0A8D9EGG1_9HEMI